MKRIFLIVFAILALTSCKQRETAKEEPLPFDLNVSVDAIKDALASINSDASLTGEEKQTKIKDLFKFEYFAHKNDTLALELLSNWFTVSIDYAEPLAAYHNASEYVKEDEELASFVAILMNAENTSTGNRYLDIKGVDVMTGEEVSLSDFVGNDGKSLLVDFWASWCTPCRSAISTQLLPLTEEDRVNIVGIAVMEDSIEDTRAAIKELGITWPVIYTGNQDTSVTNNYGIITIPEMILIKKDGIIASRSQSLEVLLY